jgi:hypothetical protein
MATEVYQIDYKATDTATAVTNALTAAIKLLDATAEKCKKDLAGFAAGAGKSAAAATNNINALNTALSGTSGAAQSATPGVNALNKATVNATGSISKMRVAMMAMQEVNAVLNAVGDGLRRAAEHSNELAEKNLKLRDSMRELANLQGHAGPDDQVAGEALLLGMASGMSPSDSVKFLEQFEGSIPAGRQKGNIGAAGMNDEQKKQLEHEMAKEGAAFGSRIGLEAATAGDLAGVIPMYRKISSVNDLAGEQGALAYGLNEGRGKVTTLMRSELGASGNLVGSGHAPDLAELGALVGVASTTAKTASSAGTGVKQLDQLLYTGKDQNGGDYLESIGVNKQKGIVNRLRVVRDDMKKNGGDDWNSYLLSKGFESREQRASTVAMATNFDVLEQRTVKARAMAKDGGATIAANQEFLNSTVTGQNRKGQASEAASEFIQGKSKESLIVGRKFAESRLRARGEIDTRETNATDAIYDNTIGLPSQKIGGHLGSREMRVNRELLEGLDKEAARVGVKGVDPSAYRRTDRDEDMKKAYNEAAARVQAAGGNPNGGNKDVVDKLTELVDLQKEAARNAQAGRGPIPPQGGMPGVAPKR